MFNIQFKDNLTQTDCESALAKCGFSYHKLNFATNLYVLHPAEGRTVIRMKELISSDSVLSFEWNGNEKIGHR
jgi:hypothetical protein